MTSFCVKSPGVCTGRQRALPAPEREILLRQRMNLPRSLILMENFTASKAVRDFFGPQGSELKAQQRCVEVS